MQANGTMPAVVVRPIACHSCGAVATVRRAKEYLCARCAVLRVGVDSGDRPVVLCDRCGRQSLVRVRESFLCARCATDPVVAGRIGRLELQNDVLMRLSEALERQIEEKERQHEELLRMLRRAEADRRWAVRRLIDAKEQERRRISMELHDDAVQTLIGIRMHLEAFERTESDAERRRELGRLQVAMQRCIGGLRGLMSELRTDVVERRGLIPALRALLERAREETGIEATLEGEPAEEPDPTVRTTLYRVAQEALANVHRHAQASSVVVALEPSRGGVAMTIRDDGIGFDVEAPSSGEHLGMDSMRERVMLVGGTLDVKSTPGLGTTVDVWVPAAGANGIERKPGPDQERPPL